MLERMAGLSGNLNDFSRFNDLEYVSKIFTNCSKISNPAERPYWDLKKQRPIQDILCQAIDARRKSFFSGTPDR